MTPIVIELQGVSKDYHGLRPLRIHELTITAAEHVAIVGMDQASGEVLIDLITGASLPDQGRVSCFGRSTSDIVDGADWLASIDRFGIVSKRAVLLEALGVLQNLAVPFTLEIEPLSEDTRERASGLAIEVGIGEASWTQQVATLDAAARARIRLGRAIALGPKVLLTEHISAGLPTDAAAALGADIRRAAEGRGAAVVSITLDESFARSVAGRVLRWDPASGRLSERRHAWFRGMLR